jgi:hypothetical protein
MSNWRDRNDRDAMVRHYDLHKEKDLFILEKKSANVSFSNFLLTFTPFVISGILFSISILSIVFSLNSSSPFMNILNSRKGKNLDIGSESKISRAICAVDSLDEFSLLVADSNGGVRTMLKFNSKYFSSNGYTPGKRCSQIAERVNTAIMSKKERYITTSFTAGKGVICISENSQDRCAEHDKIATISPSSKKNVNDVDSDYIVLKTCSAYSKPTKLASKVEKPENEEANICSFPLNQSLVFLE